MFAWVIKSPMISTTFTCIYEPRLLNQKQFAAGPVEKKSSVYIPPIYLVGKGVAMRTEFISDAFGITSALRVLVV